MSEPVVVVGAGGHAKVVVSLLQDLEIPIAGIVDDDEGVWGTEVLGSPVRGPVERAAELAPKGVLAVGSNSQRKTLEGGLALEWIPLVHRQAWVHSSVVLGPGTVVFAGAIVQPETKIGSHTIVNTGATVDHDCTIGDFAHLAPGVNLAGGVVVGSGTLMGIGSSAIPGVKIGKWVTVGAGATVVGKLEDGVTAVGAPARPVGKLGD